MRCSRPSTGYEAVVVEGIPTDILGYGDECLGVRIQPVVAPTPIVGDFSRVLERSLGRMNFCVDVVGEAAIWEVPKR